MHTKAGIIGLGVVGSAVHKSFSERLDGDLAAFDVDPTKGRTVFESVLDSEVLFVCVPTPTKDGRQDQSMVEQVCAKLWAANYKGVVCLKSTVTPGTTERLAKQYFLKMVHNPEFLTEANPFQDFEHQEAVIIGSSDEEARNLVGDLYAGADFKCVRLFESATITEMAKYMHNLFLATKVSFLNEFNLLCGELNVKYDDVRDAAAAQGKLGPSHLRVPGPDGKLGYAGMCFIKDMRAFMDWAGRSTLMGVPQMMVAADDVNRMVRDQSKEPGGA